MTSNLGSTDRIIRIILGLILIGLGFFVMHGIWGIVVGVVGFIPLLTALIGWCPLYAPFKLSTRK